MYKSQLQEFSQKAGLSSPIYEFVKEGPSHEPRFKSRVTVNGITYESAPGFPNLKSAEHAAAKVALDILLQTVPAGITPSPVHESGLCKNLLQEYAQKNGYSLPVYRTLRQGEDHSPTFSSTVEIAGVHYGGGAAKNKKEAEIKAARTALLAIPGGAGLTSIHSRERRPEVPHAQVATFVKSHKKGKKRGRPAQQVLEEPIAARLKVAEEGALQVSQFGLVGNNLQLYPVSNAQWSQSKVYARHSLPIETDALMSEMEVMTAVHMLPNQTRAQEAQTGVTNVGQSLSVNTILNAADDLPKYGTKENGLLRGQVDAQETSVIIPGITPQEIPGITAPSRANIPVTTTQLSVDTQSLIPEITIELQKGVEANIPVTTTQLPVDTQNAMPEITIELQKGVEANIPVTTTQLPVDTQNVMPEIKIELQKGVEEAISVSQPVASGAA